MLAPKKAMSHLWPVSPGKVYRLSILSICYQTCKHISTKTNPNSLVDILLNATGNVPIMKKRKWAVDQDKPIGWIMSFIHKYLKLEPQEKLVVASQGIRLQHRFLIDYCFSLQFLYVNQTFAPSPDQTVKNLYECYGSNGKLVLYYCKSQAWG